MNAEDQKELTDLLSMFLGGYPSSRQDPILTARAYTFALEGCEIEDIKYAVRKFMRGGVDRTNREFAPSIESLRVVVDENRDYRERMERHSRLPNMSEREQLKLVEAKK